MIEMPIIKLAAENNCVGCKSIIGDGDVVYVCKTSTPKAHHMIYCKSCGLKVSMAYCGGVQILMTRDDEHTHYIHEVKIGNDQKNN
jgi:Fe2+ or Zn2+ uptake regulation protein|tara:strand:+ start:285 stop:542 length:258 start_codon:yes stop_codon:yes gene_type:complete